MLRLFVEATLLLPGVVDLRVRVPELHARSEVLEPLGQRLVLVRDAREGGELDRMAIDDRRFDQAGLDEVPESVIDELRPVLVGLRVNASLGKPGPELGFVMRPQLERLERLDEPDSAPPPLQVDRVAPELHRGGAEDVE